jgi:hypothetical protein
VNNDTICHDVYEGFDVQKLAGAHTKANLDCKTPKLYQYPFSLPLVP